MSIIAEERISDSPYVETITHGRTASDGSPIRPAEIHWHMVLVKQHGNIQLLVVGPWTSAGVISYTEGAEILWIKLKLGTFLPHLPTRDFLDAETILPPAAGQSFWLNGSAWQFPDYENADTFVVSLAILYKTVSFSCVIIPMFSQQSENGRQSGELIWEKSLQGSLCRWMTL